MSFTCTFSRDVSDVSIRTLPRCRAPTSGQHIPTTVLGGHVHVQPSCSECGGGAASDSLSAASIVRSLRASGRRGRAVPSAVVTIAWQLDDSTPSHGGRRTHRWEPRARETSKSHWGKVASSKGHLIPCKQCEAVLRASPPEDKVKRCIVHGLGGNESLSTQGITSNRTLVWGHLAPPNDTGSRVLHIARANGGLVLRVFRMTKHIRKS